MIDRTIKTTLICVAASLLISACSSDESTTESATGNSNAVLISTQTAIVQDLPIWLRTVGHVSSTSAPTLAAEAEGRITRVDADTGDSVTRGQLLAETDTSTLLLQLRAAQAGLERLDVHIANGEKRVERYQTLSSRNLSSQTELDDASEQLAAYRADYKAAQAQIALVEDSLSKSLVVAPISGVIQQRHISTGDYVKRGDALFDITQPESLQAWLSFPETIGLKIRIGQAAKIYSPLTPGEFVLGKITQLQPSLGEGSRSVIAIVDLDKPGKLIPKATLVAQVLIETHQKAVLIPVLSVVRRPAGEQVYIIKGDRAEARLVKTGHQDNGLVEIISGLSGSELLAVDGAAFLTNGAFIRIAEPMVSESGS
jgi:RND family efflux transporter MFP subunit